MEHLSAARTGLRIERRLRGSIAAVAAVVCAGWIVAWGGIVVIAGMPGLALAADEASIAQATIAPSASMQSDPAAPAAVDPASSWAYDLAGELMSPYCPGRTLASCPSPQAGELIQWIAMQEAAGSTRDEVVAILIERHGEEILGAPPARGIGLWAYLLPVMGFVGFGAVVLLVLRRIVAPAAQSARASGGAAPLPAGAGAAAVAAAAAATSTGASAATFVAGASNDELARIVDAELAERA